MINSELIKEIDSLKERKENTKSIITKIKLSKEINRLSKKINIKKSN